MDSLGRAQIKLFPKDKRKSSICGFFLLGQFLIISRGPLMAAESERVTFGGGGRRPLVDSFISIRTQTALAGPMGL